MTNAKDAPLSESFRPNSALAKETKPGLTALPKPYREHIATPIRKRFTESLALDDATRRSHPGEPRWDHLLGLGKGKRIVGLEVHPATRGEVQAVVAKKHAAQAVLKKELKSGTRVAAWYWAASGRTRFIPMESATLALAKAGIRFVGSTLEERHLPE